MVVASRWRLLTTREAEQDVIDTQHSVIVNFIWGIADDVLRDLYVRGKYRDVILPMTVLRRLDAVLEPTKEAVLDMKAALDKAGITNQDFALRQAAGQAFYNTSRVHPARSPRPRQPAAAPGRLRGLPRRLLAQRPGHPRQLRVPQPDPAALQGRRPRHADREVPRPRHQPQPQPGHDTATAQSGTRASTTTPWAPSSRSWSAASTRRTTRRPASTGRPATPSSSWPA